MPLPQEARGYLGSEYTSLSAEIDRIASGTSFNGVQLLDSSLSVDIQVGIGTSSYDSVNVALGRSMDAAWIGLSAGIRNISMTSENLSAANVTTGLAMASLN